MDCPRAMDIYQACPEIIDEVRSKFRLTNEVVHKAAGDALSDKPRNAEKSHRFGGLTAADLLKLISDSD